MTDLRRQLTQAEDAAYAEFCDQLDGLSDEELQESFLGPDAWSAKDLMFHVGAWLAEGGRVLERIRLGTHVDESVEDDETERKNREWFEMSRMLDVNTVRAELSSARNRMLRELDALPEVSPLAAEWFAECGDIHYREHAEHLRGWRASRGS